MDILSIVIVLFLILECLNVFMLYVTPGTKRGNGLGVFNVYEKSKDDKEVFSLVTYLINWVAGTKLIFIALLIVILITGSDTTKVFSVIALILSILSFYVKLYPSIKKMDMEDQISPKGYSKTLGIMIGSFVLIFLAALIIFLVI